MMVGKDELMKCIVVCRLVVKVVVRLMLMFESWLVCGLCSEML